MQTTYTIQSLQESRVYRLRYRVQNVVGWSDFSSILYALVATVPSTPPSPSLLSATSLSITFQFGESLHNRGSKITAYELWRDSGFSSEFIKVETYTDNSLTHTVTQGLLSGEIYTFKYRSMNEVGYSDFSTEVRYATSLPPSKPASPTKNLVLSTETSIFVEWEETVATQVPILGYKLLMSRGTNEYAVIYEAQNPLIRSFNATNLITG